MSTYRQLQKQIADLQKQADAARIAEAARVIESIRAQIVQYDIKADDIFGNVSLLPASPAPVVMGKKKRAKNPTRLAPKYRDPISGKTWSGHGKAPAWIAAATKQGKRDDFLISAPKAAGAATAVKAPTASPKKAPAAKKLAAPVKSSAKPVAAKAVKKPTTKTVAVPVSTTKTRLSTGDQAQNAAALTGTAASAAKRKPAKPVKVPPKPEASPA